MDIALVYVVGENWEIGKTFQQISSLINAYLPAIVGLKHDYLFCLQYLHKYTNCSCHCICFYYNHI